MEDLNDQLLPGRLHPSNRSLITTTDASGYPLPGPSISSAAPTSDTSSTTSFNEYRVDYDHLRQYFSYFTMRLNRKRGIFSFLDPNQIAHDV